MKIRIDDVNVVRSTVYTDLTLVLDDGREINIEAKHSHCDADIKADDNTPVNVDGLTIEPTQIADYAMIGDITVAGDEIEVTADWLRKAGY